MRPGVIENSNVLLVGNGAEVSDVHALAVIEIIDDQEVPAITTAWFPSPKELQLLASGQPVYLTILGHGHPPVRVEVKP